MNVFIKIFIISIFFIKLSFAISEDVILNEKNPTAIKNKFLIVLNVDPVDDFGDESVENFKIHQVQKSIIKNMGGKILFDFSRVFLGFYVEWNREKILDYVKKNRSQVKLVSSNISIPLTEIKYEKKSPLLQTELSWGQDRSDQVDLPLDHRYNPPSYGQGVHAYIIDTGVRSTHSEFVGRMGKSISVIDDGIGSEDGYGHGTFVAGTLGGATLGVAPGVTIHSVRVFKWGSRSAIVEDILKGMEWILANKELPAVANLSLGTPEDVKILQLAVANMVRQGIAVTAAAGNSNVDACGFTPAKEPLAITVGGTDEFDQRMAISNWGRCLDLYAPGRLVLAPSHLGDDVKQFVSGTSMAAPHAAGAAAIYLGSHPQAEGIDVANQLRTYASKGKISGVDPGFDNLLANVQNLNEGTCFTNGPQVAVQNFSQQTLPGGKTVFTVKLKNKDSVECLPTTFRLKLKSKKPIDATFSNDIVSLRAKSEATIQLTMTAGPKVGLFPFDVIVESDDQHPVGSFNAQMVVAVEGEAPLKNGILERTYVGEEWTRLPDFTKLIPVEEKYSQNMYVFYGDRQNYFAKTFQGYLKIDRPGVYTYGIMSDEGSRLYIDGTLVVDNDGVHTPEYRNGKITLDPGYHELRVEYFEVTGLEYMHVYWETPEGDFAIPDRMLFIE